LHKDAVLLWIRSKFNQKCLLHIPIIEYFNPQVKFLERRYASIPPTSKGMGFLDAFL
jgi:hypothetical protein